jgi:hypothetical protein
MMKPEACANCGSPDISGWVTGKPSSFKRNREMLYLSPSCFRKEMSARNLREDQWRPGFHPRASYLKESLAWCDKP